MQKLYSLSRNPRVRNKLPALFVKKPLCPGDLLPMCKGLIIQKLFCQRYSLVNSKMGNYTHIGYSKAKSIRFKQKSFVIYLRKWSMFVGKCQFFQSVALSTWSFDLKWKFLNSGTLGKSLKRLHVFQTYLITRY